MACAGREKDTGNHRGEQSEGNLMAVVWIPPPLRALTGGRDTVPVAGATVAEVIAVLEQMYPGVRDRLCEGDGLRPGLAVVVDDQVARQGLREPVRETSEVHFLPAIGGG
jgi:molybdopterin synthase sulfur carrier subunit